MTTPAPNHPFSSLELSDIRGMAQLAIQATEEVTHIVEGVHQSVWGTMGFPGGAVPGQTRGLTGLVYRGIQGLTRLVGKGVDTAFATVEPWFELTETAEPERSQRTTILAILNGVMGHHLAASHNPLAIPMNLRFRGKGLNWQPPPPVSAVTNRVVVLIHGLCLTDLAGHARHHGHEVEHGAALAALGYTPVYLQYNSGLHISHNGRALAAQLEHLVTHWPVAVEDLTIVAHSMGGLLTRSACHYARQDSSSWLDLLKNIVFLGTPHHGAPLERVGNWVDTILGSTPYSAPFARLGQLRSAGITDLRHGQVLDSDWQGHDRFQAKPDTRDIVPLPEGVACYTVAATLAAKRSLLADRLIGDGLVPLNSALGRHHDARRTLGFANSAQWIAYEMGHLELLRRPEVTRQMVRWLSR
ncbi:MAG: GPI inositol-deacylase [Blastocatellia bacterium]|nr:GPI inositol-deacylase [Blastocatellia bacterium]